MSKAYGFPHRHMYIGRMYKKLARYYDMLGWSEFHDIAFERLEPLLRKHRTKSYLDMACGTGTLALTVAKMGIDVVGIDISAEMLAQAAERAKRSRQKKKPEFHRRDISRFDLKRKFDAVGCFFDAANHILSEGKFYGLIDRASRHLNPGGFFVFDVNTAAGMKKWDTVLFSKEGMYALLMKGSYDRHSRLAEITLRGFVHQGDGRRDLFRETFCERAYPHAQIIRFLKRAGFARAIPSPDRKGRSLREALRVFYTAYKT